MGMVPVAQADIRLGEPVRAAIYDATGKLLLKQGHVIASESMRELILKRGMWREAGEPGVSIPMRPSIVRSAPPRLDPQAIFARCAELGLVLHRIHRNLVHGASRGLGDELGAVVDGFGEAWEAHADCVLAAVQLSTDDPGLPARSLQALAVCLLVSGSAQWTPAARRSLCGAALTFDVGIAELHDTLVWQSEPLTPSQQDAIQAHPTHGADLLADAGIDDGAWLDAVRGHHERLDGSGYPQGAAGESLDILSRTIALADAFTAMLRVRAYREAMLPRVALRELFLARNLTQDEALVATLVKELGMYPPGSFVKLHNGEIAMVVGRGETAALPELRSVIGRDHMPIAKPLRRDASDPELAIVDAVPLEQCRGVVHEAYRLWD